MTGKRIIIILLIVVFFGISVAVFYPKERVVGGLRGGPLPSNASAYVETYECLGLKRDFCPPWPDYGCDYLCYGIRYNKKCFNQTLSPSLREEEVLCR